jgi:D5 N terminal like
MKWQPTEEETARYLHFARQYDEEQAAKRAAGPSDDEANPYLKALKKYEEEEPARRAAVLSDKDNPYRKYAKPFDEEEEARRAARESDEEFDEEEDSDVPTTPVLNLPAVVVPSREPDVEPKPKPKPIITELYEKPPYHIILGDCVVYVIRSRGEDLMFTKKGAYRYSNGLWSMETEGLSAWLNVEIEIAAKRYLQPSTIKLINEARAWIQRQDQLFRNHDDIKWDAHGLVPTRSGLVNPRTGVVRPMHPEDYCAWRIDVDYDPTAECPWWLQMLDDVFADRDPKERAATISVIQEILGAGLIDDKPRELSKALILLGGSNFGKSGLLEVMSGLFGQDFNSTPIEALERPHGTMGFLKRRPWVLHEAFDQRKWHFSSDVKTIITGEPIHINIKNGPVLSQRVSAPIFWGTNHPPQFKESTKAIANRLVVIECKREFFDDNPVGAAKEAFRRGLGKPSNLVLKEEMPGLLAWAMAGLKRALERGRLVLTEKMSESLDDIRRDSTRALSTPRRTASKTEPTSPVQQPATAQKEERARFRQEVSGPDIADRNRTRLAGIRNREGDELSTYSGCHSLH